MSTNRRHIPSGVVVLAATLISTLLWAAFGSRVPSWADVQKFLSEQSSAQSSSRLDASVDAREFASLDYVEDGDTVTVNLHGKKEKIRFIGIDAPELQHGKRVRECFGEEAGAHVTSLLEHHTLMLQGDPSQDDRDVYHRLLRYIYLDDGTDLNLKMIEDGFAYEFTYAVPYQHQAAYRAAEADARQHGRGLWNPATCGGQRLPPGY